TQTHMPVTPHPDFRGMTGNGDFADVLAQIDAYVGRLLDATERLGIRENTIFIFTADNGPDSQSPYNGFSGPWRGSYFTALEGSLRVPFIIRWPAQIPAGRVSNEIVHEMDLFPTLAHVAGGKVPSDRVIDGVDQGDFFAGKQQKSNRESVVIYVGNEIYGVKWRNWKFMTKEVSSAWGQEVKTYSIPVIFDLHTDPKEEYPTDPRWIENGWVRWPAAQVLVDHAASLQKEPAIRPGTPDPYKPAK
ncbi:MAG: sulfatase-like hydrolase/transferase, partial [Thermoanaerobaculia bacterium]